MHNAALCMIGYYPLLEGYPVRRRDFITVLGGVAAWPLAVRAQQPDRLRRIGVLIGFAESDPAVQSWLGAFRGTLAKLGWTEGSNLRIEVRWG